MPDEEKVKKVDPHTAGTDRPMNKGEALLAALAAAGVEKLERVAFDKKALDELGLLDIDFTLKFDIIKTEPVGCTQVPFINLPFVNFHIVATLYANGLKVKCWFVQV